MKLLLFHVHYYVSEASMIDSVIIITFVKAASMEDFSPLPSFAFNIHGDLFPILSTSFAYPNGSTVL